MTKIIHLKETNSTNQYLFDLLKTEKPEEGCVVVTEYQTSGKGQMNNSWESESGKNLTFSIVLYPDFLEANEQFIISKLISLAVADTLSVYTDDIKIKWPNDIYYKDKKLVGILIENSVSGRTIEASIIGIGININQEIFRSDAPNPVSLKQITNEEYDLEIILKQLIRNIYLRYSQLLEERENIIHQDYLNFLYRSKGYYLYKAENNFFNAKIKDIKPTGHLVLETENKQEMIFAFKEVEFVLPKINEV